MDQNFVPLTVTFRGYNDKGAQQHSLFLRSLERPAEILGGLFDLLAADTW